jgi:putative tryptophan/tyrosine transport system substrate-binding protein
MAGLDPAIHVPDPAINQFERGCPAQCPAERVAGMKRRNFLGTLTAAAVVLRPSAAWVQEAGRTYRLGGLLPFPYNAPPHIALMAELGQGGFVKDHNLTIDARGYGASAETFPEIATVLVKTGIDVFLAGGDAAIRAAQQATSKIPILGITEDMVGSGLVSSMARPGGNTTGISLLATELDGKRQEILIETVPGARRIAVLADVNTTGPRQLKMLHDASRARGIELSVQRIAKAEEIIDALDAAHEAGAEALNVLASPLLFARRPLIIERTAAIRLPAIYQWPETAEEGGLLAYGPRIVRLFRDVVGPQLVKLLRGARAADLPVEQATRFELVINLKTAKALGLTVPRSLLARADEVIE